MRKWLDKFMMGRYGPDQLCLALLIASFIFNLLGLLTGWLVLSAIAWVPVIWGLFRFLSRDLEARRRENDRFIRYWWPIRTAITKKWEELKSLKTYKYFNCPSCKNRLRVPRGKGRIRVTCPKCGERFEKKS